MASTTAFDVQHYRDFLDLRLPADPLLVVLGNCQAESIRLLLDPDLVRSVRVPPVFELDLASAEVLHALLRRATWLVTHPVGAGYRDLPLGTDELRGLLPAHGRTLVMPVVRYTGLHPYQLVDHPPPDTEPLPVVPYHDLRTLAAALTGAHSDGRDLPDLTEEQVRAMAGTSLTELRRRERGTDVAVSDLLEHPGPDHIRTINHPGNAVLLPLATRIAHDLDLPAPTDPGRPLLADVRAPVHPVVAATWGLPSDPATAAEWTVAGEQVPDADAAAAQLDWYARHPDLARASWERHLDQARLLGLPTG